MINECISLHELYTVIQKQTQQFSILQFIYFVHPPVFTVTKQKKLSTAFWKRAPSLSSGRKVGERITDL
jgi:hypothetical protein